MRKVRTARRLPIVLLIVLLVITLAIPSNVFALDDIDHSADTTEDNPSSTSASGEEAGPDLGAAESEGISTGQVEAAEEEEEPTEPVLEEDEETEEDLTIAPLSVTLPADFGGDPDNLNEVMEYLFTNGQVTSKSILDFFELDFYDSSGQPVENPTLGDLFNMYFEFTLPAYLVELMTGGEHYTFQLPAELEITGAQDIPLLNGNGVTYGNIHIDPSGQVTITFNDEIINMTGNVSGGGTIYGTLVQGGMTEPGGGVISIPGEDDLTGVPVEVKPNIEASVDKDGSFDRQNNPNSITWNIELNKSMDDLTNAQLAENFPAGLVLPPSYVVQGFKVDFDGNPIPGSEYPMVQGQDYDIVYDANGQPTIQFLGTLDHPVRVTYETDIDRTNIDDSGAQINFVNEATLTADGGVNLDASASLTANYFGKLEKSAVNYDPDTQTITWEIRYNFNEGEVPAGFHLSDTLPPGMTLNLGSFEAYPVTFDTNGDPVEGPALDNGDYTVTPTPGGFDISNNIAFSTAVVIRYTTTVDYIIDQNTPFSNLVQDDGGNTGTGTGTVNQQNVIKGHTDYNIADNTVGWQITVNRLHEDMHNLVITDVMNPPAAGIRNLTITAQPGGALTPIQDFTVTYNTGGTMVITFPDTGDYNPTTAQLYITYDAVYNTTDGIPEHVANGVHIDWQETDGTEHGSDDNDSLTTTQEQRHNGKKGGSYNATTKEITWYLAVNYNNTGLHGAYLDDPILAPQNFVPGSVHIFNYTEDASGNITKGSEITDPVGAGFVIYEPGAAGSPNAGSLYIELPNGSGSALYYIEFKTSLEGELIGENTYTNQALFHNERTPEDMNLTASVSVANGGSYIGKQGQQGTDDTVSWSITVNPSQSTISNVVVHDVPSANQVINVDSIVVFPTRVAANGRISIDNTKPPLVLGTDYTVDYALNSSSLWELELTFVGAYQQISLPYIISYSVTVITDAPGGSTITLSNDVKINFEKDGPHEGGSTGSTGAQVGGGSGWIVGEVGGITLRKVDSVSGAVLPGVAFELYFLGLNGDQTPLLIGSAVFTDAQGALAFGNLARGYYELREITPLGGYSMLSPNPYTFRLTAQNNGTVLDVANVPGSVSLTKTESAMGDGRAIAGAVFELFRTEGSGPDTSLGRHTTGAGGSLTVYGLPEGSYYFLEVSTPDAYVPDTATRHAFTVTRDGNGQLVTSYTAGWAADGVVYNDPTRVELTKVDDDDLTPLPGAAFKLEQRISGVWTQIMVGGFILSKPGGSIEILRLQRGADYRLTEVSAPVGYALNTHPYYFTVNADGSVVYTGTTGEGGLGEDSRYYRNYPTEVEMFKYNERTRAAVAGAVFALYEATYGPSDEITGYTRIRQNETFYTERDGYLRIGNLVSNRDYRLIEIVAPPGYNLDPTPIDFKSPLQNQGDITYLPNFPNTPSVVSLLKLDSGGNATLSGAVFRLEQDLGVENRADWRAVSDYTRLPTDASGQITLNALPPGHYRFIEVTPPDGYMLDATPHEFTLEVDGAGAYIEVLLPVENRLSEVILEKQAQDGTPLPGATFMLEQQVGEGWTRIQQDETLTTGADGTLTVRGLAAGSYRFTEVDAPDGYRLVSTPLAFTLTGLESAALTVGPFRDPPTEVLLRKVDETGSGLVGAEFALYKEAQVPGTWLRLLEDQTLATGADGRLTITGLTAGVYRLIETKAPDGYRLDSTPIPFTLAPNTTTALVLDYFVNQFTDRTVLKTDGSGNRLAGAVFRLERQDQSGAWRTVEGEWVSGANGVVQLPGLTQGNYRLVETAAPGGYVLNSAPLAFTIDAATGETALLGTVINQAQPVPVPAVTGTAVRTGDTSRFWLWAAMAVLALGGLIAALLALRRRKTGGR